MPLLFSSESVLSCNYSQPRSGMRPNGSPAGNFLYEIPKTFWRKIQTGRAWSKKISRFASLETMWLYGRPADDLCGANSGCSKHTDILQALSIGLLISSQYRCSSKTALDNSSLRVTVGHMEVLDLINALLVALQWLRFYVWNTKNYLKDT